MIIIASKFLQLRACQLNQRFDRRRVELKFAARGSSSPHRPPTCFGRSLPWTGIPDDTARNFLKFPAKPKPFRLKPMMFRPFPMMFCLGTMMFRRKTMMFRLETWMLRPFPSLFRLRTMMFRSFPSRFCLETMRFRHRTRSFSSGIKPFRPRRTMLAGQT